MWATATHRVGALLVGVALVYATVAQGAFAADQAVVVFGLLALAAAVAVVGPRRMPRPVAVAVGLLVVLAAWTGARAAGLADGPDGPDVLHGHLGDGAGGGLGVAGRADGGLGVVGGVGAVGAAGGPAGAGAGGNWLGAAIWAGLPIIAIAAVAVAIAG